MTWKLKVAVAAVVFHLSMVTLGAAHVRMNTGLRPLDYVVSLYGAYSGADASYGFFSPSVATDTRAEFTMTDKDGRQWTDNPTTRGSAEAQLRFNSTINLFEYPDLRTGVGSSWAATMFGRYPDAVSVTVKVESQFMPFMSTYREGARPYWNTLYQATFRRQAASGSQS